MLKQAYYAAGSALATVQRSHPIGRNIYSADWDICVVLDSCRFDMLRDAWTPPGEAEIAPVWSRGSITTEWLSNTFRPRHDADIGRTAFVSATPHSTTVFRDGHWLTNQDDVRVPYPTNPAVGADAFDELYEVWRSHADAHGAVPPETMLQATLEAHERHDRVVAHWLQPHEPFIAPDAQLVGGGATEDNVWDGLQRGELNHEEIWQSYRSNLEYALDSLDSLFDAVDARVLVTSDHGNAFGSWGIYGHPFGWPEPAVRRVPWVLSDASPGVEVPRSGVLGSESGDRPTADTEEQLRALGYR